MLLINAANPGRVGRYGHGAVFFAAHCLLGGQMGSNLKPDKYYEFWRASACFMGGSVYHLIFCFFLLSVMQIPGLGRFSVQFISTLCVFFSKVLGIILDADSFGIYMSLGVMVQFLLGFLSSTLIPFSIQPLISFVSFS